MHSDIKFVISTLKFKPNDYILYFLLSQKKLSKQLKEVLFFPYFNLTNFLLIFWFFEIINCNESS